jgi:hypothetical protein
MLLRLSPQIEINICFTHFLSQECTELQKHEIECTAQIVVSANRISQEHLEEEEINLQRMTQRRDSVRLSLSAVEEKRHSKLQDMLQKEETSQRDVLCRIESVFARSFAEMSDAVAGCNRLKKQIHDLEREARDEFAAWQCEVCAKSSEQISRLDMTMLFRAVGLTEEHEHSLIEHDVDGKTFDNLSPQTVAKELSIRSVNHRLHLQHISESMKNGNLASLFIPSGPSNPLSWNTEQVLDCAPSCPVVKFTRASGRTTTGTARAP